jgi:hypothetical protein
LRLRIARWEGLKTITGFLKKPPPDIDRDVVARLVFGVQTMIVPDECSGCTLESLKELFQQSDVFRVLVRVKGQIAT